MFPQEFPSSVSVQTLHGPDSAQTTHQAHLTTCGQVQH